MSDPRLLAAIGAVAVALVVAFMANRRERRRAIHAPLDLGGVEGRIVFFSDATCTRCDIVRAHLETIGGDFTEIAYDREPEAHRRIGVTGVPLVVIRDERGIEVRRFAGVMPRARLARALGRDGL
jgi:predicted DsbA family dithiol-disulfide isomerase